MTEELAVELFNSYFYRVIEWLGLERTFKDHLVQTPSHSHPCPLAGMFFTQVAQNPFQPGLPILVLF